MTSVDSVTVDAYAWARKMNDFLGRSADLANKQAPENSMWQTLEGYQRVGLEPGALVAIALPNGTDLLAHFFATLLSGFVPVLIPPATPLSRVRQLAGYLNIRAYTASHRQSGQFGRTHSIGGAHTARFPAKDPCGERYLPGDVVMLTSGTSGMFSACVNQFDALLRNARRHNLATGIKDGDTALVSLPLYYSYALVAQALSALVANARIVIDRPPFNPDSYRATISKQRIDVSALTPTMARSLIRNKLGLPAPLRTLMIGGDQLPGSQVGDLLTLHSGELYITYGLTEAGPRVSTLAAHQEPRRRWDSVGLPLPSVGVELRDVCPNGVGELVVASDTVIKRRVGLTRSQPLLEPGCIATGDQFSFGNDGYLYFVGRNRDFVMVRGEKVSLYSIKLAAESLPNVVHAQVTAVDRGEGPEIELVVHAANPVETTAETLAEQLRRLLMRRERPQEVRVVAADNTDFYK